MVDEFRSILFRDSFFSAYRRPGATLMSSRPPLYQQQQKKDPLSKILSNFSGVGLTKQGNAMRNGALPINAALFSINVSFRRKTSRRFRRALFLLLIPLTYMTYLSNAMKSLMDLSRSK